LKGYNFRSFKDLKTFYIDYSFKNWLWNTINIKITQNKIPKKSVLFQTSLY
jgi:hypothetical protein